MSSTDPQRHTRQRARILDAAARCFSRYGFQGASMARICADAEMSPGHLYHYFPHKKALIEAMIVRELEEVHARFEGLRDAPDVVEGLLALIEGGRGWTDEQNRLMLEVMAEAARNPAVGDILRHHHAAITTLVAECLAAGQARGQVEPSLDPEVTAAMLQAVVDGAVARQVRAPALDPDRWIDHLKHLYGRMLRPSGNAS